MADPVSTTVPWSTLQANGSCPFSKLSRGSHLRPGNMLASQGSFPIRRSSARLSADLTARRLPSLRLWIPGYSSHPMAVSCYQNSSTVVKIRKRVLDGWLLVVISKHLNCLDLSGDATARAEGPVWRALSARSRPRLGEGFAHTQHGGERSGSTPHPRQLQEGCGLLDPAHT